MCQTCGCKVNEHTHVKAEYQKVKVETAAYKNLKDRIALMEQFGFSQEQAAEKQSVELEKLDKELV